MSTPTFDFPQLLTEKYRPLRIADFAGLDKPKKIAARIVARPMSCALLFNGSSGTGKTSLALAMQLEMGAELHHIPSQSCTVDEIKRVRELCQYVPLMGNFHFVLVDEADQMTDKAQLALLSMLDATNFPPDTIFVFTCNDTERLEPRFLSRCIRVDFSSYGAAVPATALLADVWKREAPQGAATPNFARLVKESNNNVRESLMRLESELLTA